jgi:hypothetical protein
MLKHLETNNGRIDVTAYELELHRCGSNYTDYAPWPDLISTLKTVR